MLLQVSSGPHGRVSVRHGHVSVQHGHVSVQHGRVSVRHSHVSVRHGRSSVWHSHVSVRHGHSTVRHGHCCPLCRWSAFPRGAWERGRKRQIERKEKKNCVLPFLFQPTLRQLLQRQTTPAVRTVLTTLGGFLRAATGVASYVQPPSNAPYYPRGTCPRYCVHTFGIHLWSQHVKRNFGGLGYPAPIPTNKYPAQNSTLTLWVSSSLMDCMPLRTLRLSPSPTMMV